MTTALVGAITESPAAAESLSTVEATSPEEGNGTSEAARVRLHIPATREAKGTVAKLTRRVADFAAAESAAREEGRVEGGWESRRESWRESRREEVRLPILEPA
jgi:NADH dehydrogenase/NADH:ubiquinone oxidoreductase subunit G